MWLLIFSIELSRAIIAPDNSIINEGDLDRDMYVYSREYDEIIYESDTSDIKLCHGILNINYGKYLKGMLGDEFRGKKRNLYNNIIEESLDNDDVVLLSARCPTYLSYIKCIYSNYIQPLSYSTHQKKYSNDYLKYVNDGLNSISRSTFIKTKGGDLSFHLRQILFQFCQYITYACPNLLESFYINELQGREWYISYPCSAFDYITPLISFDNLFDKSLNETKLKEFIKIEIDAFINLEYASDPLKSYQRAQVDNNLFYTTIGSLYDVPINKRSSINKFFFIYCVELCTYLTRLSILKKYYSKEGLARFYFICSYRELDCDIICGVCN